MSTNSYNYSSEINVQIIISLLKSYGIRKVVASPGATNVTLIGSLQSDNFFEIYSSVDERSAAYIACGLSAESGEPVVLSCTGATASRNYLPGLTEAFYRKLPILAITSTQELYKVGHLIAQVIDRDSIQNDAVRFSVSLPVVKDKTTFLDCELKVNKAISELFRKGGGPVHLNVPTNYSLDFSIRSLPDVRKIMRITINDQYPVIPRGKIGVIVGSHKTWSKTLTDAVDKFCAANNAVVFCDHTSAYNGKFRILYSLKATQESNVFSLNPLELILHIGEVSGDYPLLNMQAKAVWRISEDGELRDTFWKLNYIFEMQEESFFEHYAINNNGELSSTYYEECRNELSSIRNSIPELPFSNIWIASKIAHLIPDNSVVHLGILNTLRSWNLFELPVTVSSFANVGGFGIDGCLSSLVGASLYNPQKIYFCILGDLAFFYDMNVLGNHIINNNVRIMLVNNGVGTEFKNYTHHAARFGDDSNKFMAAAGHFGNKSPKLVKHYAEDLGFEYISASNKEEFYKVYESFIDPNMRSKPIVFEIFTDSQDESNALKAIRNIDKSLTGFARNLVKNTLSDKGVATVKKLLGK